MGFACKKIKVIDGDTPKVSTNIRMLGIDTPETNYRGKSQGKHAENAKKALEEILNTKLFVKTDAQLFDRYNRLLGHVFKFSRIPSERVNYNLMLLEKGFAVNYAIYPNLKYFTQYRDAVIEAMEDGLGIWDRNDPLKELPFEFRMRVDGRRPHKYVGDFETKILYNPEDYRKVEIPNRVFFFRNDLSKAIELGYRFKECAFLKEMVPEGTIGVANEMAKISEVREKNEEALLRYPNVVGIDVSYKVKAGRPTNELCIVVYVDKKVAVEQLSASEIIPKEINGVKTDVVEVGRIEAL